MKGEKLLALTTASIVRYGSLEPLIKPFFDWTIKSNERWAVVGRVGSGKSTLGSALSGHMRWVSPTAADSIPNPWLFDTPMSVRMLSFSDNKKVYGTHSIQDRYHARVEEDEMTASQYLLDTPTPRSLEVAVRDAEGNITNRPPPPHVDPIADLPPHLQPVARKFNLDTIAHLPLIRLSNGQLMRVRLAKSLLYTQGLRDARFLVLDEPFAGLDVVTRREIGELLGEVTKESGGPNMMLLMRPQDELPDWITHVMELDRLAIGFQGTREEYERMRKEERRGKEGHVETAPVVRGAPVVELNNVNVTALDGAEILKGVDWTIRAGEKWGLTGPNGSGKTTLLAMVVGDHPQAYSNDVTLFGHRRGEPGVSIWDIKSNIGFVSPEFHMHFVSGLTQGHITTPSGTPAVSLLDVLCTGFGSGDNMARAVTPTELESVHQILGEFNMSPTATFADLSMGEQRMGLILRAVVKRPKLLVMDEPFQGVDEDAVERVHAWLKREAEGEGAQQAMVFVSHHEEEMPGILTNRIRLEAGKVVECV
ncbi:hypothetical protein HDU98_011617 [Podochytrium sp. JEL0797]|nr:hypothetical protein HDU98_011617 [Podochytrium sp. JEL0797]